MAGETVLSIVGNATADPDLRFTAAGVAVASVTVASNSRRFDPQSGEWKNGDTLFMRCNIWRDMAEHAAQTITRGMRLVVQGRVKQRSFETKDGEKRTVIELDADEIGPSLRYVTAQVNKISRANSGTGAAAADDDPWNTGAPVDDGAHDTAPFAAA